MGLISHRSVVRTKRITGSVCIFCLWLFCVPALAQSSLELTGLQQPPTIDGQVESSEWSGAAVIDQALIQFVPNFGEESSYRTVVRVGQTESAIYVAFEVFDPDPSRIAAAITRRDGLALFVAGLGLGLLCSHLLNGFTPAVGTPIAFLILCASVPGFLVARHLTTHPTPPRPAGEP